jgi:sterol desaturase/sphingolipid hydroxylase (fatty acid hydroxylase superfamily)
MLLLVFQLIGGWVYGHFMEYAVHRWFLHGIMKKRGALFSFHFFQHHKNARLNKFKDCDYEKPLEFGNAANKELISLGFLTILHAPLAYYLPWFFGMSVLSIGSYYYHHYKAHKDPIWAKKHLRCHFDHHMGKNQDSNYGVRSSFFDKLFGTREDFGAERKDRHERIIKLHARYEKRLKK